THYFPFIKKRLEAEVVGYGGIEVAEGMGHSVLEDFFNVITAPDGPKCGPALSPTIQGQNGCLLVRRNKKAACGVSHVVLDVMKIRGANRKSAREQFLPHPQLPAEALHKAQLDCSLS